MATAGRLARKARVKTHIDRLRDLEGEFRKEGSAAPPERSPEEDEELRRRRREILGLPEEPHNGLVGGTGGEQMGGRVEGDEGEGDAGAGEDDEEALLEELAQHAESGWADSGAAMAMGGGLAKREEEEEEVEFRGLVEATGWG